MKKNIKIVVLGDLLYDCFAWADRLPREGETVTGFDNGFFSGGKGANQAVQAAKLGAEVYLIGRVGNDARGKFLLKELDSVGVKTDYVVVDDIVATGTCCVHVAKNGRNAIIVAPMANDYVSVNDLYNAREIIKQADVFITQLQLPLDVIKRGLLLAKENNVTTILNPAPAKFLEDDIYQIIDYLIPNETEAEFYTQIKRFDYNLEEWCAMIADYFRDKGVKNTIVTLGSEGSFYSSANTQLKINAYPVETIDTTGAGDSYCGAFAFSLAQSNEIKKSLDFANLVSSITTTKKGSQPAMPTNEDIRVF